MLRSLVGSEMCIRDRTYISRPALWLQSIICKNEMKRADVFNKLINNPLVRKRFDFGWECETNIYSYKDYNYATNSHETKNYKNVTLKLSDYELENKLPSRAAQYLKDFFNKRSKTKIVQSLYDNYISRHRWHGRDVKFLFLSPNKPSAYLSMIVNNYAVANIEPGEIYIYVDLLTGLYDIWYRQDYTEPTYLFLASCLITNAKTVKEIAAELWIKTYAQDNIDNKRLGQILGRLFEKEYAPLKRFTDLLSHSLLNVSQKHNQGLTELLEEIIIKMQHKPIKGTKRLLELYLESLHLNSDHKANQNTLAQLAIWKETKSLKSLITKIEQRD